MERVKREIEENKNGAPITHQKFQYKGLQLDNKDSFYEYNIIQDESINVIYEQINVFIIEEEEEGHLNMLVILHYLLNN